MNNDKLSRDTARATILLLNNMPYSGEPGTSQDPRKMAQDIRDDLEAQVDAGESGAKA